MGGDVLCDEMTVSRGPIADRIYELLKCPLCTTLMSSPIQQCLNGHAVCFNCKIQLQSCCPQCGVDMGSIRCLFLEKLAESLKGDFPNYECPYSASECTATGNIPQLVKHLKDDHNVDMHDGYNFSQDYTQQQSHYQVENATRMLQVINCYGRQFCLYFEPFLLAMTPCYIAFIRFMDEDAEANKLSYFLEICGSDKSLTWEGVPRSIRVTHQKVRDSLDGLVIRKT